MRHQRAGKHLSRTTAHRTALRRNLAASLFEHGTISTTIEKAKFVRPFAEKLITLAKKGDLHARRRAISLLQDRNICVEKDGDVVKETTVISKLFAEIGPLMKERPGGYTRIVRLPYKRIGDNGELCLLQLVGEYAGPKAKKAKAVDTPAEPKAAKEEPAPEVEVAPEAPAEESAEETKADDEQEKTE